MIVDGCPVPDPATCLSVRGLERRARHLAREGHTQEARRIFIQVAGICGPCMRETGGICTSTVPAETDDGI